MDRARFRFAGDVFGSKKQYLGWQSLPPHRLTSHSFKHKDHSTGFKLSFPDMICFTFCRLNEMLKVYRRNINSGFMEMLTGHSSCSSMLVNRSVRLIVHFNGELQTWGPISQSPCLHATGPGMHIASDCQLWQMELNEPISLSLLNEDSFSAFIDKVWGAAKSCY